MNLGRPCAQRDGAARFGPGGCDLIEFSRVVAIAEGGGYYPGAMHPVALWALMDTVFRRIRSCSLRLMLVAVLGAAVVAG
ncbi:MAG TPA: hypothetical protein VGO30_18660, partial [Mycobacterium sp.]|nr:hypothetical protein [Mycobacterium sp.]